VWALGARTADGGSHSGVDAGAGDTVLLANLDDRARQVEVTLPGGETRTAEVPPGSFLPL
jgi:hypothetical protein